MSKNYLYAYSNLRNNYGQISSTFNKKLIPIPEELSAAKDKICSYTLPEQPGNAKGMWSKLNEVRAIFSEIEPVIEGYIKAHDSGGPLSTFLMNLKIASTLITRYQQDVSFIFKDLLSQAVKDDKIDNVDIAVAINTIDKTEKAELLMLAVANDSKKFISELIRYGADPFIADKFGNSAFSTALANRDSKLAEGFLLIKLRTMVSDDVIINKLYSDASKEDISDFLYDIASDICKKQSSIRDSLGVTQEGASTIHLEATKYYEALGKDSSILWGADEFI